MNEQSCVDAMAHQMVVLGGGASTGGEKEVLDFLKQSE